MTSTPRPVSPGGHSIIGMEPVGRVALPFSALRVRCCAVSAIPAKLDGKEGLEPSTFTFRECCAANCATSQYGVHRASCTRT